MKLTDQFPKDLKLTADPICAAPVNATRTVLPEWIRLPKKGTPCPWTGLSRSKLNQLILPCPENDRKPPVKSISVRKQGCATGVRLIHLESLLNYLRSFDTESDDPNPTKDE